MQVGVGYCDHPDSAAAGRLAAQKALAKAGRTDTCDLVLLFCTARHNQQVLRKAVAEVTGNSSHIYGGGAVGIITNEEFGYAGDQVGVACLWMEDSACNVLVEKGLSDGEVDTGIRLGKQLAKIGTTPTSPVMLFYDAVDHRRGDLRLLMATWILEGLEKGLGFLPDLTGAGLQGDHMCSATSQYIGDEMGEQCALALTFSDDIRIDSIIMHGCRPASPYYTVTKAEDSVILEINGQPAIPFMDALLGPAITPEDYPFFLLFGINHGERWGEYDEKKYASRLCLDIDKERNGIVMFEPDMVAGTEFQLMFRSLEMDYLKPKIHELFAKLEGRELIFSVYIDCAGRCAGYGGVEIEDALVVQDAVADRVPLLGLYTGVEIASIGGRPRGLDWTGVFCVFSRRKAGEVAEATKPEPAWSRKKTSNAEEEVPINAMINLCKQNTAKILALDTQSITIRHELEQKRRSFSLLAELAVSLRQENSDESIFVPVTQKINAALNMQKDSCIVSGCRGTVSSSGFTGIHNGRKSSTGRKTNRCGSSVARYREPCIGHWRR